MQADDTSSSFDYFPHEADMGIIGRGISLEQAFTAAASAVFAIMADPAQLHPTTAVPILFDEDDLELALVTWLNQLLGEAQSLGLIFSRFELQRDHNHWRGIAWGQPWTSDICRGAEVKGATLTMLAVRQINSAWEARCVVDM